MKKSEIYSHETLIGYLFSFWRKGRIWRLCANITRIIRHARIVRIAYRLLSAILFFIQTGATAAIILALFVALIPLLLIVLLLLLAEHAITCLRWRTVLRVVFSYRFPIFVFFYKKLPTRSFACANATELAQKGGVILVVFPFRTKELFFRGIKRTIGDVFLITPSMFFYIKRRYLSKNKERIALILSDFDTSTTHYTTRC